MGGEGRGEAQQEHNAERQGRPHTRDEATDAKRQGNGEGKGGEEEGRIDTAGSGSEAEEAHACLSEKCLSKNCYSKFVSALATCAKPEAVQSSRPAWLRLAGLSRAPAQKLMIASS